MFWNRTMAAFVLLSLSMSQPVFSRDLCDPEQLLSRMTLDEKIGQLLMPDFRTWKGSKVTALNEEITQLIRKDHLGGVILFSENIVDTEQTIRLTDQLQKASAPLQFEKGDPKIPLFVAVDQEGGLVSRIPFMTEMPGAMALGATRSKDLASRTARAIAEELLSLGFNLDFAPVLDVNVNPDNPVIGVRSFGSEPRAVEELGLSFFRGLQEAGIAATVKHFPGHGDTDVDSHLALPSVPHPRERLKSVELRPFQRAMDEGVDLVMSAHVTFPAIDDTLVKSKKDGSFIHLPATLSRKVLTGLMREEMGYRGVIVTDAFSMKAIADHFGSEEAVIMAIKAGADIVLMPSDVDKAFRAIRLSVERGEIPLERIDQSVRRILSLKLHRGLFAKIEEQPELAERIASAKKSIGSAEHRAIAREVSERCVTLLRNEKRTLPFPLQPGEKLLVLAPSRSLLDSMRAAASAVATEKKVPVSVDGVVTEGLDGLNGAIEKSIDAADCVILANASAGKTDKMVAFVSQAIAYAQKSSKPLATLALRNPYDVAVLPGSRAFLAVFGKANISAGMRVIFGINDPEGRLPVSIPGGKDGRTLFETGFGLEFEPQILP